MTLDALELGREIRNRVSDAAANHPRSKQKAIGPSEIGSPCARRLAYRLLDIEPVNSTDGWLATIGVSVHAWLADTYLAANAGYATPRYLVEHRVEIAPGLSGSADVYDTHLKTVIDWKVVGDTTIKRVKKDGPGIQYRTQIHSYALGFKRAGYDVENVTIAFLPRGGSLRGLHIFTESFDESIALDGVERLRSIEAAVRSSGTGALKMMPGVESYCHFCPFHLPACTDLLVGCPGADAQPNPTR